MLVRRQLIERGMMWAFIQRVVGNLLHVLLHIMVDVRNVIMLMVLMSFESGIYSRPERIRRSLEL